MIAQVRIPDDADSGYTMTLDDEGQWVSTEFPEMASAFNQLHADSFGEWNGSIGAWQAHDVAEKLLGEIIYLRS